MTIPSDIEIARAATLQPIGDVAERLGVPDAALVPYGRHIAKLDLGWIDGLKDRPDGRLVLVTAITPTPAGEGKTTTTVGLGDGLNRIGKQRGDRAARAIARALLRHEGRGRGRRLCPGRADGADQPALHRRLPRHRQRPQPAGGDARQPHLLGQRAGPRRAADRLAPCHRHERPLPAPDRLQPRRRRQRLSARGRFRHHRGLRGDGGVLPRHRPRRPRAAARPDDRRLHARAQAGHRGRPRGIGRHDGAAQGRAGPEPGADPGGQSGLRPWRPVRQHRARLQLGDGDPHRAQARRIRRHRGRLRRRPGSGEVLRHQVPQGRADPGGGGDRGDRARAQDAWRRRQGRSRRREPGGLAARAWPISTATCATCAASACRRWWRSTGSTPTPRPSTR